MWNLLRVERVLHISGLWQSKRVNHQLSGVNRRVLSFNKSLLIRQHFNVHLLRLKLLGKGARSCTALFLLFNLQVCTLCLHLHSRVLNFGNQRILYLGKEKISCLLVKRGFFILADETVNFPCVGAKYWVLIQVVCRN